MHGKKLILIALLFLIVANLPAAACTIVMVSDQKAVLAGSNEDSTFPLTMMWYIPAGNNSYARICFGYKLAGNSVQGGMNEKGLFVDGNSLGSQGWLRDSSKKASSGSILDIILANCANLEEVKEYFNTHNVPALDRARIPVMDKSGASMIVEWYDGKTTFLEEKNNYQIATNFVGSKYPGKEKPCWRYKAAEEILCTKSEFSLNDVENALKASHVEGNQSTTVYSFICDLNKGDIYIYNFHDYENPIVINFDEEIRKGEKEFFINKLFSVKSSNYENFIADAPVLMIKRGYNSSIMAALIFYNTLKTEFPAAFGRELGIDPLSVFGNSLIDEGKLEDGIIFLTRNASDFPESSRTHWELGKAFLRNSNNDKAISEFNKVLEIDPNHIEAKTTLQKISR